MRKRNTTCAFLLMSLLFHYCSSVETSEPLFEKLTLTSTNIDFENTLASRKGKLSAIDYLYYYNGAGVACGDINNDGLTDIFFVSNEHKNKLYLNEGNFQFKDISEKSGIGGFAEWKTGVTMTDINGDGFLDIYVCAVGDYMGLEGSNELYINNGDLTFSERSAEYGLDFTGFSTQAAFFDYDHDGDLDMYLLTHAKFISRSYTRVIADLLPDQEALDYLFRNEGLIFKDVSEDAGIRKAARGYGLGVSVADLNNDGWEDIYVTNDFYEDDHCFINNQDGTFTEKGKELFGHFSHFSRGCDIADVNNDGYEDLLTVDMHSPDEVVAKTSFQRDPWDTYLYKLSFGYHYQFSRNCLQINNAGHNFSDLAPMAGVTATDCSWSPLIADYDNDGYKDIFITNGIARRLNDLDYLNFAYQDSMRYSPQLSEHQIDRALNRIPEGKFHNYLYKGKKDFIFEDKSEAWGMLTTDLSSGAIYADLDNDGDLDIVTNNLNEPAGIYKNHSEKLFKNNYLSVRLTGQGKNMFGVGARIYLKTKNGFQLQHVGLNRGFLSSIDPTVHFGLAGNNLADSLIIVWNDEKIQVLTEVPANRKIIVDHRDARNVKLPMSLLTQKSALLGDVSSITSIPYIHRENKYSEFYREKLIPFLVSMEGPKIAVGDVNKDGREDFYVGGAKYQPGSLFLQQGNGEFVMSEQPDFTNDSIYEDVDAAFFDMDHDKDLDLYVVSGGNEFYGTMDKQFDRVYKNDGSGQFKRDLECLPLMYENKSCVRPCDFDNDGDMDVFIGGRVVAYHYGNIPQSFLLLNDGKGSFANETNRFAPGLEKAGMITDAVWADTDGDGDQDLILSGDWMPIRVFENSGGQLKEIKNIIDSQSGIKNMNGFWQCLVIDDFDHDGDVDFMAGNLGLNTVLRKNIFQPVVKMYVGDFDMDKKQDQIVAYKSHDGKFYPAGSKEELETQIPSVSMIFKSNSDFAGKTVEEWFESMKVEAPEPLVADQLATLYFKNTGKNNFILSTMPYEVQVSKVFSFCKVDVNEDGNMDVLAGGNYNGSSIYQGIYDASYGTVLQSDGKGNFMATPPGRSGFNLAGEVRDIKSIETPTGEIFLIARNGKTLQLFSKKNKSID